jgi:hypothetical protein
MPSPVVTCLAPHPPTITSPALPNVPCRHSYPLHSSVERHSSPAPPPPKHKKGDILDVINSWPEAERTRAFAAIQEIEDQALRDMKVRRLRQTRSGPCSAQHSAAQGQLSGLRSLHYEMLPYLLPSKEGAVAGMWVGWALSAWP